MGFASGPSGVSNSRKRLACCVSRPVNDTVNRAEACKALPDDFAHTVPVRNIRAVHRNLRACLLQCDQATNFAADSTISMTSKPLLPLRSLWKGRPATEHKLRLDLPRQILRQHQ